MLENDVNGLAELDKDILTFDVSDDALERAAPLTDRRSLLLAHWGTWRDVRVVSAFGGKGDMGSVISSDRD